MLTNTDWGMLILRLVVGGVLFAHGAQKLLGWFGGRGLAAVTDNMRRMGMHPPRVWALLNACGESLGGLGFVFGLLTPVAAMGILGSMLVAIIKVHWSKGFWNTVGGFEFPMTLAAAALAVGVAGPGPISLDQLLGLTRYELAIFAVALVLTLIAVIVGLTMAARAQQKTKQG